MKKLLIKNCTLISMSETRPKIEEKMDIAIINDRITQIDKNIESSDFDKIIDANQMVAMPGLINTHSHISMSVFRETVDGYKTQDWLKKEIWPREDKLTKEDVYWASLLSCIEMIKTGTTTVNDMYFFTDSIIKAALDSGIRLQTSRALLGQDKNDRSRFSELKELIEKYKDNKITFNAGIHGLYTCNKEYMIECVKFAKDNSLPIHMHFCENEQEREDIIRDYKVSNPASVIESNFDGVHNLLAHCVKINSKDIQILKNTNTFISHCPISNLKLGCGIAPVKEMLDAGICVSLGTDGQGSGSNLDMFETMKFTALLQKGINENPQLLDSYDVLKMATINGAKALMLEKDIGSIENGKLADIILLDMSEVLTKPLNNIFAEIVYNIKGYNVNTTIINGDVLMENYKLKQDINNIFKKCDEICKHIF